MPGPFSIKTTERYLHQKKKLISIPTVRDEPNKTITLDLVIALTHLNNTKNETESMYKSINWKKEFRAIR